MKISLNCPVQKHILIKLFFVATFILLSCPFGQSCDYLKYRVKLLEERVKELEAKIATPKHEESPWDNSNSSNNNSNYKKTDTYSKPPVNSYKSPSRYSSNTSSSSYSSSTGAGYSTPKTSYSNSTNSSNTNTSPNETISKLIRSRLFKKQIGSKGQNSVSLLIAFTNANHKDLKSFRGVIILKDFTNKELTRFPINVFKHIPSYESESWFGEVPYSPSQGYRQLLSLNTDNIDMTVELKEIIYSDGSIKKVSF